MIEIFLTIVWIPYLFFRTKYVESEDMLKLLELGINNFGENRVDALSRYMKYSLPRKYIYKDGRERLTFTIKINKN